MCLCMEMCLAMARAHTRTQVFQAGIWPSINTVCSSNTAGVTRFVEITGTNKIDLLTDCGVQTNEEAKRRRKTTSVKAKTHISEALQRFDCSLHVVSFWHAERDKVR